MANINVLNMQGEVVSSLKLSDNVYKVEWNDQIIYDVVKAQRAAMRNGSSQTKNRSDVSGGGRKPYKQKGTGHARQGTIRAPQYRGGGHVFELHPRDYSFSVNKKVRRQALRIALSDKVKNNKFICLENLQFEEAKTKAFSTMLSNVKAEGKVLIVVNEFNANAELSSRNIPGTFINIDEHTSVYDILNADTLLITSDSAKYFEEALKNE